jgi:hypothetical protein
MHDDRPATQKPEIKRSITKCDFFIVLSLFWFMTTNIQMMLH